VVDIKVRKGLIIRGRVLEQGTDRPLAAASVQYISARRRDELIDGWRATVRSHDDGSYQIVVPPGKGTLFVYGPTHDYALKSIGEHMVYYNQPGGRRAYAHEIVAYEVKEGDPPREINASLRAGKTVKGRLIGPNGQTVERAEIIALLHFNDFHPHWRGDLTIRARDGRFVLHGLDSEAPTRVSFLDAGHQWGATVELSGKQAGDDVTIQLKPCGQAKLRLIHSDGKPVANTFPYLEILGSPGRSERSTDEAERKMLTADAAFMPNVDRVHYWKAPVTDAEGRITLPDLIPGATYRITDESNSAKSGQIRKDFTVKPAETLDLGDILIEKPDS
jgi:hypothetical protein